MWTRINRCFSMTTKTPSFWKGSSVDRAKVYIPWLAKTCKTCNSFTDLKITTVKPLKYGHQRDRTRCPLYRGVRIIEEGNVWFLAFLGPNELCVIERCPYYRGVRKERLDCKNFKKGWVTFHVFCFRYVFLVHGRQKKHCKVSEIPCTSYLVHWIRAYYLRMKQKDNRPQSRVFVLQTRGSFLTTTCTIYIEWKKHWTITMPQHNT